jgi:hypothetical protein
MSLYAVQKAIYEVNRSAAAMAKYRENPAAFAAGYELTAEEAGALAEPDIGLLYVLGVNGQLLMHFAAACGYEWNAYIEAMNQGLTQYGPVRAGLYATVGEPR